jgi:hypothetical protein
VIAISAVSLTPLKSFQQCQWQRWNHFSSVNDTTEIRQKNCCGWHPYEICHFSILVISAVSLMLLKPFQHCHWYRWNHFSSVTDTTLMIPRSHWHHWNDSLVSLTLLKWLWQSSLKTKEIRIFSISQRPRWGWLMKKSRDQNSHDTVPLSLLYSKGIN